MTTCFIYTLRPFLNKEYAGTSLDAKVLGRAMTTVGVGGMTPTKGTTNCIVNRPTADDSKSPTVSDETTETNTEAVIYVIKYSIFSLLLLLLFIYRIEK